MLNVNHKQDVSGSAYQKLSAKIISAIQQNPGSTQVCVTLDMPPELITDAVKHHISEQVRFFNSMGYQVQVYSAVPL
ncbi:gp075 [Erwinia phage vB_EamP-S6]|uniref:Gp075 n=1 Tax=Erwinia phage vB_EamP-S6 TaxID=1051675 RepID=G0YQG7_9CAUD|nr:gp075 [Erwinia phage vB_EamP-S6]AEJ81594.1 gp075 [Erwinia phage vB_EamP-S6]